MWGESISGSDVKNRLRETIISDKYSGASHTVYIIVWSCAHVCVCVRLGAKRQDRCNKFELIIKSTKCSIFRIYLVYSLNNNFGIL